MNWRPQREVDMRTRKESERARGTDFLESGGRRTSENTKRRRTFDGHSLSGEGKVTAGEDMERKSERASEECSLAGGQSDRQVRTRKRSERGELTSWRAQRDGRVRTRKESERWALTSWRTQSDGQVRTQKEKAKE
jgi:hypothetical protein